MIIINVLSSEFIYHRYLEKPLCHKEGNLEEQFMSFEDILQEAYMKASPSEVLTYLKPEESKMDPKRVKQSFMDVKSIYEENGIFYANISLWNGDVLPWQGHVFSLDLQGHLHGTCTFVLPSEHYNSTGTHDFLNWSIKLFSGNFIHGKLNGIVILVTWNAANIYATFKDGELHGPTFAYGRIPVFDIEVLILY